MAQIAVKKRLYSTSALATVVGRAGDTAVDTTKYTVVVFDGVTAGGIPLALDSKVYPNATNTTAGFESAADHVYLYTHTHPNATSSTAGFMSAADYNLLQSLGSGPSTPSATGNIPNTLVLRDSSGNFAANVITASLTGNASTVTNGVYTTGSYSDPAWITALNAGKLVGIIPSGVSFAGTIAWTQVSGKPTVVSYFINDAGYINGSGNTTGTSGGVLSTGGRETASPTPNTVIIRSSTGTAQVATPVASADIATKAYVDANAGGNAYYPSIGLSGSVTFPQSAAFSTTICNVTENGYIKSIFLNMGSSLISQNVDTNTYIGITVDGNTEFLVTLQQFINVYFGILPNILWTGGPAVIQLYPSASGTYLQILDLTYKSSLVVRLMSTVAQTSPSGTLTCQVNRYIRTLT